MSKTIDEKVVEMRFDNKHFESNVKESMSTLDKLKQKLNLSGASKSLENLNKSANKVNMNGMTSAIDSVSSRFSALEIMGTTALVNITNSAINAGKRIVSSLTIAPVKDGFSEYELMLNSIQTTMAGTGKTAEQVEEQLKKLDEYADKTVYSTADMLNNLPKFTNAGVDLEDATVAMIGIANATALAGGDANKASIAYYNLGQAMSTGYLTRMDYNSINNAGIATMEWKNQMVEAAIAAGTLTKAGDNLYKSGNKTFTMQQLFIDGLQTQWATTDVMMKVFSDYGNETTEIGKKAYASAQNIKTFSMMLESLKATAGTGWKDTWQIIFGDLGEATEFWTGLTNFFSNIINSAADFRNKILDGILGRGFKGISDTLKSIIKPIEEVKNTLLDYNKVVDEIIAGKWGNAPTRWEDLTAAGYDWAHAQNLVNERLGDSTRHATNYTEAQAEMAKAQENTVESVDRQIEALIALSDAELKALGYTDEQIQALRDIKKYSDMTGISLKDFIENIDKIDGRWLLINIFKNAAQGLCAVFKAVGDAWLEIFPPEEFSEKVFNLIAGLHKFSLMLRMSDDTADKLKRTMKGVFAILDIVLTLIGGPIKLGVKIIVQFLQALGILPSGILNITACVGDSIVAFRDWLDSVLDFTGIFKAIIPYLKIGASYIGKLFNKLKESKAAQSLLKFLRESKDAIIEWVKGIKDAENIPKYIFEGLINGLKTGAKGVIDAVVYVGQLLISSIKKVLGIHSPSTVFFEIGKNIIQGLFNGLSEAVKTVYTFIMSVGQKLIEIVKSLDLGSILSIVISSGFIIALVKMASAFKNISKIFGGVGDLINEAKDTLQVFQGTLKSFSTKLKADAIKSIAIAIAILVASIVALSFIPIKNVWSSVGAILVLMGVLAGIIALIGVFTKSDITGKNSLKEALSFGKIALLLLGLGVALASIAKALKTISSIDPEKSKQAIIGLAAVVAALVAILIAISKNTVGFASVGTAFIGIGIALLLITNVVKKLGKMDPSVIRQGEIALLGFAGIIAALMLATKLIGTGKDIGGMGKTIFKISAAILVMTFVAKILGKMDPKVLSQGEKAIITFSGIIVGLMAATRLISAKDNVGKIGKAILSISGAMLLMSFAAVILGKLDTMSLAKGIIAIGIFSKIISGLIASTKLVGDGQNVDKIGKTILSISGAIAIMALTAVLLGMVNVEKLAVGIIAVAAFAKIVEGLIKATKGATSVTGTMIAITAAIAVLATSIGILSLIEPDKLLNASLAMGLVLGALALVIKATGSSGKATGTILSLALALAVLGGALFVLGKFSSSQSLEGCAGISLLLLALTGILYVLNKSNIGINKKTLSGIVGILALCVPLVAVAAVLSKMKNVSKAESKVKALSILMGALTAVLVVLNKTGGMSGKALLGIVGMLALCVPLVALVGILALMQNISNAEANVKALSTFMLALSVVQILCGAAGAIYAATGGMAMLGLVGMVALVGTLYLLMGALAIMSAIPDAISNMEALSKFLLSMSIVLGILTIIGPIAGVSLGSMGALAALIGGVTILAGALGALITFFPDIKTFIDKGIDLLVSLAQGLGEMIGAFVYGIATQVLNIIPDLGTKLSQFMDNAQGFIEGAKKVDSKVLEGTGILVGAIGALVAVDFFENVVSFLNHGETFDTLGVSLSKFMHNVVPALEIASTVDPSTVDSIKAICESINTLATAKLKDAIANLLGSDMDIEDFADNMGGLGKGLGEFSDELGDDFNPEFANRAAQAVKYLAEAAKTIPNKGGLLGYIFGNNDPDDFGDDMEDLGKGMRNFYDALGTDFNPESYNNAAKAINYLTAATKEIPNKGGVAGFFAGNNDPDEFGDDMEDLGEGLRNFYDALGADFNPEVFNAAAQAIDYITAATKKIPNKGGVAGFFAGENDPDEFGDDMADLGEGLASFVNGLGFMFYTGAAVTAVENACSCIRKLADLVTDEELGMEGGFFRGVDEFFGGSAKDLDDVADDMDGLVEIGEFIGGFKDALGNFDEASYEIFKNGVKAIEYLGDASFTDLYFGGMQEGMAGYLQEYIDAVSIFITGINDIGEDNIKSATDSMNCITEMLKSAKLVNFTSANGFKGALKQVGEDAIEKFVNSLSGKTPIEDVKEAIDELLNALKTKVTKSTESVEKVFKTLAKSGIAKLCTKALKSDAKDAGEDLVKGFANGIKSKDSINRVTSAGTTIGNTALKAAKEAIDAHSPSREAFKIGEFFDQGFVGGIKSLASKVYDTSYFVGEKAKTGLNSAISMISDAINSDIDSQPTIRPVLDLSDVESGAGYLNSMFNDGPALGVMSNLGAISYGMNTRNQNGANDDVISAIDKLNKNLANAKGGDTYNFDGITYDDGSNITDAVKTIVRAAKIGRRV